MKKYRHEFKYLISDMQAEILKQRIHLIAGLDKNVNEDGYYSIRSLYFDDYDNRCFYENINGIDPRGKFRIRTYNNNINYVSLEYKRKERSMTLKNTYELTEFQYKRLIDGKTIDCTDNALVNMLNMEMRCHGMRPIIIVGYDRIPFVYEYGNVRITIDTNLYASDDVQGYLLNNINKRPVLPIGLNILEVKWDEYLPDAVFRTCQLDNLTQTAFSKYCVCRRFYL